MKINNAEQLRLKELDSYNILYTESESDFDNITRLIANICKMPVAAITFVGQNIEWFKSIVGLDKNENSLANAFCAKAIVGVDILIVPDALKNPDFFDNPMVIGKPYIRFYAGVPLLSPNGYVLGTLAVKDYKPRMLSGIQIECLKIFAKQIMVHLELRRHNQALKNIADEANQKFLLQTKQLEKNQEFLSATLESLSEGIVACDEAGNLSFFNTATRLLHGLHEESLPPEKWSEQYSLYMPDGVTPMTTENIPLRRAFRGEKVFNEELVIAPTNLTPRVVVCNGQPITNVNGVKLGAVIAMRDITKPKQLELELKRLNRALQMRSALNEIIIHAADENEILNNTCRLAVEMGGYYSAWIGYAHNNPQKSIESVAAYGEAVEFIKGITVSWSEKFPEGLGLVGRTVRTHIPIFCEDFAKDVLFKPWLTKATEFGLKGAISLPLGDQQKTFGVLYLFLDEVHSLATEELTLLKALADDVTFGILSLRTKKNEWRVQDAVLKMAASSSSNISTLFEQLTQNMAIALKADGAFISQLIPQQQMQARTITAIVDGQTVQNFDYLIVNSPCKHLLVEELCVITQDVADQFPNSISLQAFGAQSYVGHSLKSVKGETIGFIFLLFRDVLEEVSFVTSTLKIFAARAAAELELQSIGMQVQQQASLLDKARDAIIVHDLSHRILYWNKSAERLYGWTEIEARQSLKDDVLNVDIKEFYNITALLIKSGEWSGEILQRRKDGSTMLVEGRWTLVLDKDGQPESVLAINTDITARKTAQAEIINLAFYDPLTHLPNRLLLIDRLNLAFNNFTPHGPHGALLFIDLDHFKTLNDSLGHAVGDLLLIDVAKRLLSCVREIDTVARLGGDEFVVMVLNMSNDILEAASQAKQIAENIMIKLNKVFHLDEHIWHNTPSIGITLINLDSENVETVLKQADLAMYQAKASGRNAIRFYNEEMQKSVANRVALETDLRQGLFNQEFLLHYQPQVNQYRQVIGAEALIRWHHPTRGLVPPIEFIPIAEESRLIIPIGLWVLETACRQLVSWAKQPSMAGITIAVNVSIYQFRQDDFVQHVMDVLKTTGADPKMLKIELTESLMVDNVEDIIKKMAILKAKGVAFSLDDFGTGYSSLSYLKRLPLDQLKIDQSFVRDIMTDSNDASIACTIVSLAHNLGLSVIAEGVETEQQRKFLLTNKCFAYQGYLFSKPVPIEQFENYVSLLNNLIMD